MSNETFRQEARPEHYLDWVSRGNASPWRYALVAVLGFFLAVFILPVFFFVGLVSLTGKAAAPDGATEFSFLPGLVAILILVRLILARPAWSVALPSWPPSWRLLGAGLLIGLVVCLIPPPFLNFHYEGFSGLRSAGGAFILMTLLGLLLQTAAEEVLFRGLFLQAVLRLTGLVWVAVLIQALVFAWLHIGNLKAWHGNPLGMAPYLIVALVWGWVAWRTGSLLVPWMLHFTNNASNVLIFGVKGDVIQSIGPVSIDPPSIIVGTLVIVMQAVLYIGLVEAYLHWSKRRRVVGLGPTSP